MAAADGYLLEEITAKEKSAMDTSPTPPDSPHWTFLETCNYIRKSESWLWALLKAQRELGVTDLFPAPGQIGGTKYFWAAEVKAWLQKTLNETRN